MNIRVYLRALIVSSCLAYLLMATTAARAGSPPEQSFCTGNSAVCFFVNQRQQPSIAGTNQRIAGTNQKIATAPALPARALPSIGSKGHTKRRLPTANPDTVEMIRSIARKEGVPELLALAIASVESGINPNIRSHQGATGVMQILPRTARSVGWTGVENLRDPAVSATYGIRYLKLALQASNGDLHAAAARYNAGIASRVRRSSYSRKVMARYASFVSDSQVALK